MVSAELQLYLFNYVTCAHVLDYLISELGVFLQNMLNMSEVIILTRFSWNADVILVAFLILNAFYQQYVHLIES